MKKLYIKFEEGNKDSLQKAVDEAEILGYTKHSCGNALDFEGHGILICTDTGVYYTSQHTKRVLKTIGYTEYKITEYKEGDRVRVRDNEDEEWKSRIYLHTFSHKKYSYACVGVDFEESYRSGGNYGTYNWRYIKHYKGKVTIKTEDGQTMKIEKDKAIDLGFNFND